MSINVAVIGCGAISRFHLAGLEKAGARIAWVCDINEKSTQALAAKYGCRTTKDYREAIADPAVDAVWVLTFSTNHKEICLAAIAAGKAVVCEKTLATNPADALGIVNAARAKGAVFFTSYMKRFMPATEKAKELLPRIGRILTTHIRAHQCWGDVWTAPGSFLKPSGNQPSPCRDRLGGGILLAGGSHILDLMNHLVGRPDTVSAHMATPDGCDVDGIAAALFTGPNGVVHWETMMHAHSRIGYLKDGWDERVEIVGAAGRLEILSNEWNRFDTKAAVCIHFDAATDTSTEYRFAPVSPFERAVAAFCADIAAKRQTVQNPLTGYETDEMIGAIQDSAESGKTVNIQWKA
jgi:predicted dehydrogenase